MTMYPDQTKVCSFLLILCNDRNNNFKSQWICQMEKNNIKIFKTLLMNFYCLILSLFCYGCLFYFVYFIEFLDIQSAEDNFPHF